MSTGFQTTIYHFKTDDEYVPNKVGAGMSFYVFAVSFGQVPNLATVSWAMSNLWGFASVSTAKVTKCTH